jgi:enoyl-CoA hydratase/carnithine racemase
MLALACDYRVMTDARSRRAWMSMNEIEFGAPWPTSFGALLRAKAPGAALHRAVALEGRRFTPQDALAAGLVDELAGPNTEAVLAAACERAAQAAPRARTGVWGIIKVRTTVGRAPRDALTPVRCAARHLPRRDRSVLARDARALPGDGGQGREPEGAVVTRAMRAAMALGGARRWLRLPRRPWPAITRARPACKAALAKLGSRATDGRRCGDLGLCGCKGTQFGTSGSVMVSAYTSSLNALCIPL